jgi:hypothetical protein
VLGDRDRATLHEIQNQFLLDDPGFVQSFDARPFRSTGSSAPPAPTAPTAQRRRPHTMFRLIAGLLCMLLPAAADGRPAAARDERGGRVGGRVRHRWHHGHGRRVGAPALTARVPRKLHPGAALPRRTTALPRTLHTTRDHDRNPARDPDSSPARGSCGRHAPGVGARHARERTDPGPPARPDPGRARPGRNQRRTSRPVGRTGSPPTRRRACSPLARPTRRPIAGHGPVAGRGNPT